MKKTISILIPCYNESKTLSKTLPIMEGFFTEYYPEIELVFVNDGSKDDTESVLQVFQKMSSLNTQIISYTTNKGKGYAVKTGIQNINTDYTIMMDADLATDLSCIHETMNNLEYNDIIIGDRTSKQAKRDGFRKILGKVGQRCTQSILHLPFNDTQAGYKAFSKATYHIWNKMRIERWGFDFEFLYLAQKEGLKIHEQKIIRNEQKISRVTLQSYIDTFDELMAVRWYHSSIYNTIRNTNIALSTFRDKAYATSSSKVNTPMSWALIVLSGILLTSSTSLVAQYSNTSYSNSGYYAGGSTQTGTYINSNIVRGSSNSRGSNVGRSTSYSPSQSGFNSSGTNYSNYNQNYIITGNNTSGYVGNYDYLYKYYYSGNSAGTSYHNYITGAGTTLGTGSSIDNSVSTSYNEYNYISDDGSGTAYAFGSKYSVSSSQSRGSTTQYRSDCSGICSKGSTWGYYSGTSSGTNYSRNISNYGTGNYTLIGTGFYATGSSMGTNYAYGTSSTGYSYEGIISYGSTYSNSSTFGSGVDGSGSRYEWGTYIRDNISTGKNSQSGTYIYSIGSNGSGSCVYTYENESRWKRITKTIYNRFTSPNRNSSNYDYYDSYEYGNTSSYTSKCDGGICGGCRECGPYSQGSKCVFKQPGKAVEYPTFVNPIYPYDSPTPGVDFLGTGDTYAVVCGTPPPPPSCACGGTYPSCNTCGGGDYVYCGDGSKNQASEQCDDGNTIDNDLCNNQCKKPLQQDRCGDNIVQTYRNEVCDDGNNLNGDGCDNQCLREGSGTGSTGSDYLNLTLIDPASCGMPFQGTVFTNKSLSQVSITLEFRQSGVLKKTITFTPTSNNYTVDISGGENYIPSGTYSISLVGKVDSLIKSIELGSIPIEHICPENPNDDPIVTEPQTNIIEKFIHGVADLLPGSSNKIIPKTGAEV